VEHAAADQNNVFLAYLHPHEVTSSFHKSLIDLIGHDLSGPRRLHSWCQVQCGAMGIPEGRNDACRKMLLTDCEWLFFIDADMGFEPWVLEMLLSVADPKVRPVVGALAFAQRETGPDGMNGFRCRPNPTIMDFVEHPDGHWRHTGRSHYPVNALVKCSGTGAACLLIHRSALEAIGEHWFYRIMDPAGKDLMGEDVSFCERLRVNEIPLHIHTGIRTSHFKHLWLSEPDFWTSFVPPPATERVDVIIPVLHRPQNVEPLMTSLIASTGLATAWFVCEAGDEEEIAEVIRCGGEVITSPECHSFPQKVNLAYDFIADDLRGEHELAPWILLVGDDVRFRPAWLDHAQDVARRYGAQVVGTNDLANPRVMRGEHSTHSMIRRSYIDELGASWDGPGVVCHESYFHWCVDDEIVTVAKQRGVFQSAMASEVEHLHPYFGGGEMDEVYKAGEKHAAEDKAEFERRVKANLPH
jgi:hypothetical protein